MRREGRPGGPSLPHDGHTDPGKVAPARGSTGTGLRTQRDLPGVMTYILENKAVPSHRVRR